MKKNVSPVRAALLLAVALCCFSLVSAQGSVNSDDPETRKWALARIADKRWSRDMVQPDEELFDEITIDRRGEKYGLVFRDKVIVPHRYDAIAAENSNRGFILQKGRKYGLAAFTFSYGKPHHGEPRIICSINESRCRYDRVEFNKDRYWAYKGKNLYLYDSAGRLRR